jgi:hypothetical protein
MDHIFNVRISPLLRDRFFAEAELKGVKPTDLIRFLMVHYLDRRAWEQQEEEAAHAG